MCSVTLVIRFRSVSKLNYKQLYVEFIFNLVNNDIMNSIIVSNWVTMWLCLYFFHCCIFYENVIQSLYWWYLFIVVEKVVIVAESVDCSRISVNISIIHFHFVHCTRCFTSRNVLITNSHHESQELFSIWSIVSLFSYTRIYIWNVLWSLYLTYFLPCKFQSDAHVKARIGKPRATYSRPKSIWKSKQLSVKQHSSQNFQ